MLKPERGLDAPSWSRHPSPSIRLGTICGAALSATHGSNSVPGGGSWTELLLYTEIPAQHSDYCATVPGRIVFAQHFPFCTSTFAAPL